MDKYYKVPVREEDAISITSFLSDFDGDVTAWKVGVYELFRWDMTYSFAYKIHVYESRNDGVFVRVIAKPEYEEAIKETMEDIGFRKISLCHEKIGIIDPLDVPEEAYWPLVDLDY